MGIFIQRKKGSISFKAIVGFVILAILFSTVAAYFVKTNTSYASALPYMSAPTKIIETSSHFNPILLRGLEFFPNDPFAFRFTLDEGDTAVDDQEFKIEAHRLIKYFLASLTTPAQDLWVNLSPYEKDRVTPHELGLTDMGRDLLGEDYILKQLTASLTYPESPLGKKFWKKIYARANELYGTTNIAIDTFNKIWIIPDKAVVSVEGNRAFVKESSFKVMMESDYVAQKQNIVGVDLCVDPGQNNELYDNHIINHNGRTHRSAPTNDHNINKLSAQIAKEMILPVIEEEINKGQQFARLRQIYNALILATWFKKRLRRSVGEGLVSSRDKNKNILDKIYFDKNKIKGIEGTDPQIKEKIYNQYVEAYKKGVYNYIRPDFDEKLNRKINRRYYSGGFDARENEQCLQEVEEPINSVISTKANGPISGIDANGEFLRQSKPADTYAVDSGLKEEPKHDKKKSLRNAGIFLFFYFAVAVMVFGCASSLKELSNSQAVERFAPEEEVTLREDVLDLNPAQVDEDLAKEITPVLIGIVKDDIFSSLDQRVKAMKLLSEIVISPSKEIVDLFLSIIKDYPQSQVLITAATDSLMILRAKVDLATRERIAIVLLGSLEESLKNPGISTSIQIIRRDISAALLDILDSGVDKFSNEFKERLVSFFIVELKRNSAFWSIADFFGPTLEKILKDMELDAQQNVFNDLIEVVKGQLQSSSVEAFGVLALRITFSSLKSKIGFKRRQELISVLYNVVCDEGAKPVIRAEALASWGELIKNQKRSRKEKAILDLLPLLNDSSLDPVIREIAAIIFDKTFLKDVYRFSLSRKLEVIDVFLSIMQELSSDSQEVAFREMVAKLLREIIDGESWGALKEVAQSLGDIAQEPIQNPKIRLRALYMAKKIMIQAYQSESNKNSLEAKKILKEMTNLIEGLRAIANSTSEPAGFRQVVIDNLGLLAKNVGFTLKKKLTKELLRIAKDSSQDGEVRSAAISASVWINPAAKGFLDDFLQLLRNDQDFDVLSRLSKELSKIAKVLKGEKNKNRRTEIVVAIGLHGLLAKEEYVRDVAAMAMEGLCSTQVKARVIEQKLIPMLITAINQGNSFATIGLGHIFADIYEDLSTTIAEDVFSSAMKTLKHNDSKMRFMAIEGLGNMFKKPVTDSTTFKSMRQKAALALIDSLEDNKKKNRDRSRMRLTEMGSILTVEVFKIFIETLASENKELNQKTAKLVIEVMSGAHLRDIEYLRDVLVPPFLKSLQGKTNHGNISSGFRLIGDTLFEKLFRALESENKELREAASRVLYVIAMKLNYEQMEEVTSTLDPFWQNIFWRSSEIGRGNFSIDEVRAVYLNSAFIAKTLPLAFSKKYANQFSLAKSVVLLLERFDIQLSTEDNYNLRQAIAIEKALFFIVETFDEANKRRALIQKGSSVYAYTHVDKDFTGEQLEDIVKPLGVTIDQENRFEGVEDKIKFLEKTVPNIPINDKNNVLWHHKHGGPEHLWLRGGKLGREVSDKMEHPWAISYQEYGEALMKRAAKVGTLSDLVIIIGACYSANFAVKLVNYLFDALEEGSIKDFPTIVVTSSRDSFSYITIFEKAFSLVVKKKVASSGNKELTLEDVRAVEEVKGVVRYEDVIIFLPVNSKRYKRLKQEIGVKEGANNTKRKRSQEKNKHRNKKRKKQRGRAQPIPLGEQPSEGIKKSDIFHLNVPVIDVVKLEDEGKVKNFPVALKRPSRRVGDVAKPKFTDDQFNALINPERELSFDKNELVKFLKSPLVGMEDADKLDKQKINVYLSDHLPETMDAAGRKEIDGTLSIILNSNYINQDNFTFFALGEVIDHEYTERIEGQPHHVAAQRQKKYFSQNETQLTLYHAWVIEQMSVEQLLEIVDEYENHKKNEWGRYEEMFYSHVKEELSSAVSARVARNQNAGASSKTIISGGIDLNSEMIEIDEERSGSFVSSGDAHRSPTLSGLPCPSGRQAVHVPVVAQEFIDIDPAAITGFRLEITRIRRKSKPY